MSLFTFCLCVCVFVSTCLCVLLVIVYAVAVVSLSLTHFGGRPHARALSMIFSVRVKKKKGVFLGWGLLQALGGLGRLFGAALFTDQRLVDVRDDTTAGDRRLDQTVQLLVSADGELQVTRRDTLHLQILGCVAGQLEDLSGQVLEDCRRVDGCRGTDASVAGRAVLQVPVDTTDGELKSGTGRAGNGLGFRLSGVLASFASCHFC